MGKRIAPRKSLAAPTSAPQSGPKSAPVKATGRKPRPILRFQALMEQKRERMIWMAIRTARAVSFLRDLDMWSTSLGGMVLSEVEGPGNSVPWQGL